MKPTLILLPGLLCDATVWRDQVAALSEQFICTVPDYGQLDSIPAMAAMVLALAPGAFLLAGHSMGGRVALEIMRREAQRVTKLVLLDTGYQARAAGEAGEREAQQRMRLVNVSATQGMRAMGTEWLRGMVSAHHWADAALLDTLLSMIERKTPEIHAAQIRALLERPDATDVLPRIGCPTLVICGREDEWSPLALHERMTALIPTARLSVIENTGHMSTIESPSDVTDAIRDFAGAASR
jgi:pimeloyl-ACP methyl ester carboxylesterase